MIQDILRLPGDNSGTPPLDPIPNSTVKRSCADGTTSWESRSSPGMSRMSKSPFHSEPSPVTPDGAFFMSPLLLDHNLPLKAEVVPVVRTDFPLR